MKGSIGKRLFMQIISVLLLFTAIALAANALLLKPIYNTAKKSKLIEAVDYMDSLNGEYNSNHEEILEFEEKFSSRIIIFNEDEILYITLDKFLQGQSKKNSKFLPSNVLAPPNILDAESADVLRQFIPRIVDTIEFEKIDEKTTITSVETNNKSEYLMLETRLSDNNHMIIVSEMQSLNETVRIFNILLLGTAAITLLIMSVMTYILTKKFVKPITNMNDVTKKIADLDFQAKCMVNTNDELEELSNNINALSGSLESTIGELREELEKTKKLSEMRKRFVSTISHELKTPISLMQGYAIGLSSDVCEEKERRDYYAQVIAEESERLGALVNELMDLTQLESGFITLHEEDFELSEFIEETVNKFQAANQEKNIIFKNSGEYWCRADVRLIERVIGNYLSNAIRHSENDKDIIVEITNEEDIYLVSVMNYGKQIPVDKIDEIWNSFYRVDDARSRADGGHGLGLSIVKNIQLAHNMPYNVENVEGGVRFSFGVKKAKKA